MQRINPIYFFLFFLFLFSSLYSKETDLRWQKLDSAVRILEKTKDGSLDLARAYYKAGRYKSNFVSLVQGHEYYYKAIRIYKTHQNQQDEISLVYYMIASDYLQTSDEQGLQKVVEKLRELGDETDSPPVLYHYYSIQAVYYCILLKNGSTQQGLRDSSLLYFKKSIALTEEHKDSTNKYLVFAWNYYNVADLYNTYFFPSQTDSTEKYLGKMQIAKKEYEEFCKKNKINGIAAITNMEVSIWNLKAWIHYHRKEYAQAEVSMLHSLSLLAEPQTDYRLLTDYKETYAFLAMYYEERQHPLLALKYLKLLNETEKMLYDINKTEAIDKLAVQYETEQKEFIIHTLKYENQLMMKNQIITIGLTVFLILSLILSWILFQYKKRHLNQKVYEALLNADMQKEQSEYNKEKIQLLEAEQAHLMTLAKESDEKAKQYEQRLEEIKQKLNHKPEQIIVEKIKNLVNESILDKKVKITYLEKLDALDLSYFENLEINAKEKLSAMDLRYMYCFAIDMSVPDISLLFNVEPASVHTVRYRIRKKVGRDIL